MQGLDTHDAYEKLKESNFNDKQARGIVNIVKQAITGEIATKADIARLDAKLDVKIGEVRTEIGEVRTEIANLRTELKTDIETVRTEVETVRTEVETVRTEVAKQHTRTILWTIGAFTLITGAFKALDWLLG